MRFPVLLLAAAIPVTAAAQTCPAPPDRAALEVRALVSELALHAKACGTEAQYNSFVRRYAAPLEANEAAVTRFFAQQDGSRRGGAAGQRAHDNFITVLANVQSEQALPQGSDFCPRNAPVFDEAMALDTADDLPPFAAGKNFLPTAALDAACTAPAAAGPTRRPAQRRRR